MNARDWFLKAQSGGWAIGAFNVDNLEIFKAICEAGKKKRSPVMLEFSQGEVDYFGLANIVDLVENAKKEYGIPILLNLDHSKKVGDCLAAIAASSVQSRIVLGSSIAQSGIELGTGAHPRGVQRNNQAHPGGGMSSTASFDDIHFDGSELSFDENVANTKRVVEAAHSTSLKELRGASILVEGEIDRVSGSSEVHTEEIDLETLKKSYTDPGRGAKFVAETGVDIFASVFGNVHGTFPNQPDLDFELLKKIREALPNTFLSMHGGSGIPADQVREAIKVGMIVKVNVNTELRQAFHDSLGEKLGERPDEATYYKLTPDIIMAVEAVVEGKIDVFGSAGKVL